jgi:DNA-binding transcriptional LysR family regulator
MLARLRHAFSDELLVRVGRNLEPTDFASGIAARVHETVQELESLLDASRPFEPKTERRAFRISASDYAVLVLFGATMRQLADRAPNMAAHFVRLDLDVGERLASGEIDFAVLPAEFEPSLPSLALFDDTWVCAAWAGHPSIGDHLTIEEFLRQRSPVGLVKQPAPMQVRITNSHSLPNFG